MEYSKRVRCIAGVFGSLAFILAFVIVRASLPASVADLEGLQDIMIEPAADVTVDVGGSVRFTAKGDYATTTMPVRAVWSITEGGGLGTIEGCQGTKSCMFTAGDRAGTVQVRAEKHDENGDYAFGASVTFAIVGKEAPLENPFKDELPAWAFEAIVRLYHAGIIKGYDDGRYGPGDPVTRGQAITLIHRMLTHVGLIEDGDDCTAAYGDTPSDHYAFTAACVFKANGWASDAAAFHPDDAASRGELAVFLERTFGQTLEEHLIVNPTEPRPTQIFDDVPPDHLFYAATWFTNAYGLMTGNPNGDFDPGGTLNRAASATVMYRLKNLIEEFGIEELAGYDPEAGHGAADASSSEESSSSSETSTVASSSESSLEPQPVSCSEIADRSFAQARDGDVAAYVSDYGLYVCVGSETQARVVHDKGSGVNFPAVAGRSVVYFKEYGINVYDVDTENITEVEPKHSGSNMPSADSDFAVYYKKGGIVAYHVNTGEKTQIEPENSGSNKPTVGGDYAAYFKSYGISVYNLVTHEKTAIEPAGSGCNDPKIEGLTLRYKCNYRTKTFDLGSLGSSSSSSAPAASDGAIDRGVMELSEEETGPFWNYWGVEDGQWKKFQYRNYGDIEIERVYYTQVTIAWALTIPQVKMVTYTGPLPFEKVDVDVCREALDAVDGTARTVYVEPGTILCLETGERDHIVKIGNFEDVTAGPEDRVNLDYVLWAAPGSGDAAPPPAASVPLGAQQEVDIPWGLTGFDFSAGAQARSQKSTDGSFYVTRITQVSGNQTISVMVRAPDTVAPGQEAPFTFTMVYKTFDGTTLRDCLDQLKARPYTNAVTVTSNIVCVRTPDGYIVKLRDVYRSDDGGTRIRYLLWEDPDASRP